MSRRILAIALCSSLLSGGCFEFIKQTNNPDATFPLFGSMWKSETSDASTLMTGCTNFTWAPTERSANQGSGNFTATCFALLAVTGTAQATYSGSTINWTATGVANGAGITNCVITLTGTAVTVGDRLTLTYMGDTCQGPIAGNETLIKA